MEIQVPSLYGLSSCRSKGLIRLTEEKLMVPG